LAEVVRLGSPHRLRPLEPELAEAARVSMRAIRQLTGNDVDECEEAVRTACKRLEERAADLERAGELDAAELLFICSVAFHLVRMSASVATIVEMRRRLPENADVPSRAAVVAGS